WLHTGYRTALLSADPQIHGLLASAPHVAGIPILIHVPAFAIVMVITWLLLRGARESATANNIMVIIKLIALSVFVVVGATHLHPENYHPFAPNGFTGIHQGAAIVFFAYIGFDAISTAAEETTNPQRNLPIGILGGLAICTLIYVVIGAVLTGMVPYKELGVADPLARARDRRPGVRDGRLVRRARRGRVDVRRAARLPVRPAANLLRDGARRTAAAVGRLRQPEDQDSVDHDDHHRRVRGVVGADRRRGGDLRPHEHRNALRIHAGQHRRPRPPQQGARPAAAVQGAVRVAGVRAVGRRLRVHHVRAAAVGVGALRHLARDWARALLHVRVRPQQAAHPRSARVLKTQRPQPLLAVRVIDLTRLLPGAYATLLLANLGADVIKVEDPQGGDGMRSLGARVTPSHYAGDTTATYFDLLNRGKRSVTLDLRHPEAAAVLDALLAQADVVVDSFRPSTARRLGVDAARLRSRRPRLICASMTGFGQAGPYAERAAHDINYQALAGLLDPPALPGPLIGDVGAAMQTAIGILAALVERQQSGEGSIVEVPIHEAALAWSMFPTTGDLEGACYTIYQTADGEWLALGALEEKFW